MDSMEARQFGERLCEKSASDWSSLQIKDDTAKIAVDFILAGVSAGDITEEVIPDTVDKSEVKRLVSQGELLELPDSSKILVKRCLLYTSPSPRDGLLSRMPSSA